MGRTATGVRAMRIDEDGQDCVIGMICVNDAEKESIMVVSEQGYGKRSDIDDYRIINRGGKGVKTLNVTDKTGKLVAIKNVTDSNDLIIINKSGITIRLNVSDVRIMGRATQGVRLINLEKRNDQIASVCCVSSEEEDEDNLDSVPTPDGDSPETDYIETSIDDLGNDDVFDTTDESVVEQDIEEVTDEDPESEDGSKSKNPSATMGNLF